MAQSEIYDGLSQGQWPSTSAFQSNAAPVSLRARSELNDELSSNVQKSFQEGVQEPSHAEPHQQLQKYEQGRDERDLPPPYAGHESVDQQSQYRLDPIPVSELSFLEYFKGDATLSFLGDDGDIVNIQNISRWMFEERSPLLYASFEPSRSGPKLHLEALTSATAIPFLRYLYTGSYAFGPESYDNFSEVPTSVLLHCHLYRLGDLYDMPGLKSQAYVNVIRQGEFGCSSPDKPIDLCAAIEYIYIFLRQHENLVDIIINYCVSCFLSHRLGDDDEFQQLPREFHQDLCKHCIEKCPENDVWGAIIKMSSKPSVSNIHTVPQDEADHQLINDIIYYFHDDEDEEMSRHNQGAIPNSMANLDMVLRPRNALAENDYTPSDMKFSLQRKRRDSLTKNLPDPASGCSSDEDYDIVSAPISVEEMDADSRDEADTLTESAFLTADDDEEYILPGHFKESVVRAPSTPHGDRGSDSEWSVI